MTGRIIVLGAWVLSCASSLLAEDVSFITWGPSPDLVASNLVTRRTAMGGLIPFDLDTPLTPIEGYKGGLLYAGIEAAGAGGLNAGIQVANNDTFNGGGNDTIRFGRTAKDAQPGDKVSGFFFWKRSDFGAAGAWALDSLTVTKLSFCGRVNGRTSSAEARFVICSMGKYMISSKIELGSVYTDAPSVLGALPDIAWYAYTPLVSVEKIGPKIQKPVFSNVDGVGLFLTAINDGAGALSVAFSSFSAQGGVAP